MALLNEVSGARNPAAPTLTSDITFVYGALRSGTTLFRLMLEAHGEISNSGEADFLFDYITPDPGHPTGWRYDLAALQLDRIFQAASLTLPEADGVRLDGLDLLSAMMAQYTARTPGLTVTLNVHRNIDRLLAILPQARLLHILRDPRDVARSSISMGWAGTLYHGVDHWVHTEKCWARVAGSLSPGQVFELKYETLLADVEGALRQVCTFLGRPYDPGMLNYHKSTTYGPPDASLVEQWRRLSSPREVALLEAKAGALMQSRGYRLNGPVLHLGLITRGGLALQNKVRNWRFGIDRFGATLFFSEKLARHAGLRNWHRDSVERMNAINRLTLK